MLQVLLSVFLIFAFSGCATMGKGKVKTEELEMRISDLEAKVQEKDDQIKTLEARLETTKKTEERKKVDASKISKKDIQAALKNAGYYNGPVDGKFGQLTASAIMEFQKANGLKADGKVGQQTWAKLSEHLE